MIHSTLQIKPELTEGAITDYKESLKKSAESLLFNTIPAKIVKLNDLLRKFNLHNANLSDIHQDVNIPVPRILDDRDEPRAKRRRMMTTTLMTASVEWPKVYTLPNGPSPCNKILSDMMRTIKPYFRQLVQDASTLKMWISYLIPKIEDGDNFGVSIQGATLTEIESAENQAEEFLKDITDYFMARAKMVSKVVRYPHIEDYRRAVRELDENQYFTLWFDLNEVRNCYCVLHDIVTKNLDKIKKPRISNVEALY